MLDIRYECGRARRYALFLCPECRQITEKRAYNGKKQDTCGCVQRSQSHHDQNTKMYNSWAKIIQRCTNKNNQRYKNYGGRGIRVCDEWMDYKIFKKWALANGYKEYLFIDRINNDGNYEPSNCRFITSGENSRNRSNNKLTWGKVNSIRKLHSKKEKTVIELCNMFGVTSSTIYGVVNFILWIPES